MKQRPLNILNIGKSIILIFFLVCAFAIFPQPAQAQNTVVATITGFNGPWGLAATPNGEYVYVTNQQGGYVSVITTTTNMVTTKITGLSGASGMAITPNGAYVYVVNSGRVSVISTVTNLVTATITGLSASGGIAVTPNGEYVYVSNRYGSNQYGDVSVISTATNTVTTTITGLNQPGDLAITPNGAQVYVVSGNYGTVSVISTATNTVATTLTNFNQPCGVTITLDGEYAYVTNYDGCTVSAIKISSNTVTATIDLNYPSFAIGPTDVEMTPDGAYAYVVGEGNGIVSVISLATNTLVTTLTVGSGINQPFYLAITPNGAYAYITLWQSNTVSVINVLPAVDVTPSPWTMDVGQTATFTANPSDGSGTYTSYQWFVDGINQTAQVASTFNYSPASVGSHSISSSVTDSFGGTSAQSTGVTVTVNSELIAPTASASLGAIDQGQVSSLTSTAVTSGTSPYSYQWLEKAPGAGSYSVIVAENSPSYFFVTTGSTTTGAWSFKLQVTDNVGSEVTSSPTTVTVASSPTVSIAPVGPVTMDLGQIQTFSAAPSGGTGTLSYQFYLDGSEVGTSSASYSYTASGTSHLVTCKVTDSASVPVTSGSNAVTVTVNSALAAPTISASLSSVDQGQSSSLTSTAMSTGTSSYTYQWLAKAPGDNSYSPINSATSSTYSFETSGSTIIGTWNFKLQITDNASSSIVVTSTAVSVIVNADPSVSVSFGSAILDVGQSQQFNAIAIFGSGSYSSYNWYVDGSAQSGATAATFSFVPVSAGSYSITVKVADSLGVTSALSSPATVSVAATPTVSIVPAGSVILIKGEVQIFTVTASGGSNPLSYQWYMDGAAISGATRTNYSYTADGTSHAITCAVTDSASLPVAPTSNNVMVTVNQLVITVTQGPNGVIAPTTANVNYGGTQTFTITPNSGYYIESITTDTGSVTVTSPSDQTVSFTNIQTSHTITATFALTSTPTPSPTTTPTPTSMSTPLFTATPTPAPSIPEFPLWTIPLLLTITLALAGLLFYHKRKPKPFSQQSLINASQESFTRSLLSKIGSTANYEY
jgi:YVTN family beta-propeller protein